jgi:hypothetical protein
MYHQVVFFYDADFYGADRQPEVISVKAVDWFADWITKSSELIVSMPPIQEDFGVVFKVFVQRSKFWIGVCWIDENRWLVSLHHWDSAFFQRISSRGRKDYKHLVETVDSLIRSNNSARDIQWFTSSEPIPSDKKSNATQLNT